MILVDTSIWIDLLGRRPRYRLTEELLTQITTCPPVVQEVLQGIQNEAYFARARESFLSLPCVGDPVGKDVFLKASDLFRSGRRRGLTIRSSIDCLIAVIAIESRTPIWHRDRDFDQIAKFTDLPIFNGTGLRR